MFSFVKTFTFVLIFCLFTLSAQEDTYLQKSDISRLMQEMFNQHVDKKEISKAMMQETLENYVEQFDPHKQYFLQREVAPYLNPQDLELESYIASYKQGHYDVFMKLDDLAEKSVKRARRYREVMESRPGSLFSDNAAQVEHEEYAQNKNELRTRIKEDLLIYIDQQNRRFGKDAVGKRQKHILNMYEQEKRAQETEYLDVNLDGTPLDQKALEHQFSMRVLKSMTKSLDSHSRFFNPSEAKDMRSRLLKGYVGTGLVFEQGIDGITVVRILKDSPAEKEGSIKVGDRLLRINDKDVDSQSFSQSMQLLEGDAGESVRLTMKKTRGGSTYQLRLVRENIFLDGDRVTISSTPFDGGIIGKITLNAFYRNDQGVSSELDVKKALEDLRKIGPLRGLVFDLRENSGGYLSEAVKVAGLFISNGVVVMSQYYNGDRNYYRDIDGKTFYDGPLVVLISRSTASAAEIVAQALQDYGVAVIAGDDRSYGKGSIQSQNVTDGSAASFYKVTVGKYYTVSGKTPQVQGVASDVIIPGRRVFENIGEQYLEDALANDIIEPAFEDQLKDVKPEARRWFVRYYLPTLQPRKTSWQKMVPELKRRSSERLVVLQNGHGYSNGQQMSEAVNILRDMSELRTKMYSEQVGSY